VLGDWNQGWNLGFVSNYFLVVGNFDWKLGILTENWGFWLKIGDFDWKLGILTENWGFWLKIGDFDWKLGILTKFAGSTNSYHNRNLLYQRNSSFTTFVRFSLANLVDPLVHELCRHWSFTLKPQFSGSVLRASSNLHEKVAPMFAVNCNGADLKATQYFTMNIGTYREVKELAEFVRIVYFGTGANIGLENCEWRGADADSSMSTNCLVVNKDVRIFLLVYDLAILVFWSIHNLHVPSGLKLEIGKLLLKFK
jgi:hypothetical protein